jgi:hypothetical protein
MEVRPSLRCQLTRRVAISKLYARGGRWYQAVWGPLPIGYAKNDSARISPRVMRQATDYQGRIGHLTYCGAQ